jgi:hypothetical protein
MLLIHCLKILPIIINGINVKKIKSSGTISLKSNPLMVYTIARTNLALGSKLCKKDFFFMNLKAFRKSKDI